METNRCTGFLGCGSALHSNTSYEAKLQNSAESLEIAFLKLGELEEGGGSAIS